MRMYRGTLRRVLVALQLLLVAGLGLSVYWLIVMELPGVEAFASSRPAGLVEGPTATGLSRPTSDELSLLWGGSEAEETSSKISKLPAAIAEGLGVGVLGASAKATPAPFVPRGIFFSSIAEESIVFIECEGNTARPMAGTMP